MGRRPILKLEQVRALRKCDKAVSRQWRRDLMDRLTASRVNLNYSLPLGRIDRSDLDLHGTLLLWARQSLLDGQDFSVGLSYEDGDGHTYEVVRCNGGSHAHPARWLPELAVVPHVHYLTEKDLAYTNGRGRGDHVAFAATWRTMDRAVLALGKRVNLPLEEQEALALGGDDR